MSRALLAIALLAAATSSAGSEPTRVVAQAGVKNAYPRWSRDGKKILFESNRSGKWHLYLVDRDGQGEVQLTRGEWNEELPDWSPDNKSIAFVSDREGSEDIWVMNPDGTGARVLAKDPARDIHPYWAPDGKTILFNSTRDAGERLQIYEVRADGTGLHRLVTDEDDDTCARVSPDGKRIVYLANLKAGRDDIMICRRDGQGVVNVTNDAAPDGWPTWTPDGARLVFSSQRAGAFALYTAKPDGSEAHRITDPPEGWFDGRPSVSHDGRWVAFNREKGDTIEILVMTLPK